MTLPNSPIVSVVMPIFCHSETQLTTAINSILNQTFRDLELIIVDGRLDNQNFNIISTLNDPRIKYFKIKGYINCLNLGIQQAKGKYIARMDSDDISYPNRIEEQVKFLDNHPDISLCSCLVEFFGDTTKKYSQHTYDINNLFNLIKHCEFVHTAMMFRRSLNLHYDNIKPLEDCLLFRKLMLAGHKFAIIDKIMLKSYHSTTSIMAKHPRLVQLYMSKINLYALLKYCHINLTFADNIFSKKYFRQDEIIELLTALFSMQDTLKQHKLKILKIAHPYFLYLISKTKNKYFLLKSQVFYQTYFKFYAHKIIKKFLTNIFSVTNKYIQTPTAKLKKKVICILGLKITL